MASSHQYPPHTFHHHFTSHHHIHGHHTYSPSTSPNSSRFRTTPSPPTTYITSTSTSPAQQQHRSPHLYPTSLSTSVTSTTSQPERRRSSSSIPIRSRSTSLLSSSTSSSPHDKMISPIISSPHQHFRSISTDTRTTPTPIPSGSVPTSTSSKPINAPSSAPNVQRTNVTTTSKSALTTSVVSSTTTKSKPDPCAGQPPISPRLLNDILTLMEKTQDDLSTRLIHLHTSNKQKKERLNQLQSQFTLLQPSTHTLTPIVPEIDDDDANDYIVVNGMSSQQDENEDEPYSKNFCNTTFTCAAAAKEVMNTMTSTYLHHINMAETTSKKLDDEIHEIQTKLHGMRLRMRCLGALSCHVKLPEYQQHIDNMKLSANKRATTQ